VLCGRIHDEQLFAGTSNAKYDVTSRNVISLLTGTFLILKSSSLYGSNVYKVIIKISPFVLPASVIIGFTVDSAGLITFKSNVLQSLVTLAKK